MYCLPYKKSQRCRFSQRKIWTRYSWKLRKKERKKHNLNWDLDGGGSSVVSESLGWFVKQKCSVVLMLKTLCSSKIKETFYPRFFIESKPPANWSDLSSASQTNSKSSSKLLSKLKTFFSKKCRPFFSIFLRILNSIQRKTEQYSAENWVRPKGIV